MNEENKSIGNLPENAPPAENGDQGGKMFSQDEVNKIVSDRLARDREKRSAQQQEDTREAALKARETKLDCREYLTEKGYPAELLDILDTSDLERFRSSADKLHSIYGQDTKQPRFVNPPRFTAPKGGGAGGTMFDPIRDAFKP